MEKEALSVCDIFAEYLIIGMEFEVQTDHKPLVPLLRTKELDDEIPVFHLPCTWKGSDVSRCLVLNT
jgi:hypothetical protein